MQTVILNSDSKVDLKLLLALAKKLGIQAKILTKEEIEEMGLANAIKKGKTDEYVNTELFLKILRK